MTWHDTDDVIDIHTGADFFFYNKFDILQTPENDGIQILSGSIVGGYLVLEVSGVAGIGPILFKKYTSTTLADVINWYFIIHVDATCSSKTVISI